MSACEKKNEEVVEKKMLSKEEVMNMIRERGIEGIGNWATHLIMNGVSSKEVNECLKELNNDEKDRMKCIRWYRNDLKNKGLNVPGLKSQGKSAWCEYM